MKILILTGYAKSGKDTVFQLLNKYYPNTFERYAFADALKDDLKAFLFLKTGLDVYSLSGETKEIVRPLLVAYGCMQRNLGDGLHWVKEVEKKMLRSNNNKIKVITDARFPNEVDYFKNNLDYKVYVAKILRILDDGPLGAPNEEEARNQPLVDLRVDHVFESKNTTDLDTLHTEIELLVSKCTYHYECS